MGNKVIQAGTFESEDSIVNLPSTGNLGDRFWTTDSPYQYRFNTAASVSAITVVQSRAAVNTVSLAFSSNVTAGNVLVVAFGSNGDSVTAFDSLGTAYISLGSLANGGNYIHLWYGVAPLSGTCTVTLNGSASWPVMALMEISGLASGPVDLVTFSTTNTGYGTVTGPSELIVIATSNNHSGSSFSQTAPTTLAAQATGADGIAIGYYNGATTGVNAVSLGSNDGEPCTVCVSFKPRALGGAWESWGPIYKLTEPKLANFTQVNCGSNITFDTSHGGIATTTTNTGGDNVRMLATPVPTPPYYIDAACTALICNPTAMCGVGVAGGATASDKISAGMYGWESGTTQWKRVQMNSTTSFNNNQSFVPLIPIGPLMWYRFYDDGASYWSYWISTNGQTWMKMYQETRNSFFTPAQAVLVTNNVSGAGPLMAHWLHFSIHT